VHQLRQTRRSLVAIFIECRADDAPLGGLCRLAACSRSYGTSANATAAACARRT
jgi:hypothetical protein